VTHDNGLACLGTRPYARTTLVVPLLWSCAVEVPLGRLVLIISYSKLNALLINQFTPRALISHENYHGWIEMGEHYCYVGFVCLLLFLL